MTKTAMAPATLSERGSGSLVLLLERTHVTERHVLDVDDVDGEWLLTV